MIQTQALDRPTRKRRAWVYRFPALLVAAVLLPAVAEAQLFSSVYVSGLNQPLAFVQDPSDPTVQYVVEKPGRIRVVKNGVLRSQIFLDLTNVINDDGERGLLGLAFPPDYASSRRFYVNFTNLSGHTVVARFRRNLQNALVADGGSRFDFRWPGGLRVINQPASNHNGGNMAFGPDGYLYIGMGDGGGSVAPPNSDRSQDPNTLLGKMLRVDVDVADDDPDGYVVPDDNPFVDGVPVPGALHEIWAFGLRNPWRWAFDTPSLGGTGALLIADVGQNTWEEINYQPAGRGALNYGWSGREGAHDFHAHTPAYTPLTEPIIEYSHDDGDSVTGGYVYRGSLLGASFYGRYFYGDLSGRVWSAALSQPSGQASNNLEHTAALGGTSMLGNISSFGIDARGELYVVSLSKGTVFRILNRSQPSQPWLAVDVPPNGSSRAQPFNLSGWAVDLGTASGLGTGVDAIRVQAFRAGVAPVTLTPPTYGYARPDVGAFFGSSQFTSSGFGTLVTGLQPGQYQLVVSMHSTVTNSFNRSKTVNVNVTGPFTNPIVQIDGPIPNSTRPQPFLIGGWAVDLGASSGTGVDVVSVSARRVDSGVTTFLGNATYGGPRPDVAQAFARPGFMNCSWGLFVTGLTAGTYDLTAIPRSTVTGKFAASKTVRVTVTN